ncbi:MULTISPECIES: hypothetical protein [Alphaproteobacteria]|uniref:hypothetical protein n=1 Tax=Alphaproteobacteria TaxID=28211 RepID=UPI00262D6E47|nr:MULTISPECIES: hypothetical protein [Alphaproteobacteria]
MIQVALSVLLIASAIQDDGDGAPLATRNLEVDGWYCDSDDCSSTSQDIDRPLRFDQARSHIKLTKAESLPEDWTVIMQCRVTRRRLSTCRVVSDTSEFSKATPIARTLADALRVVSDPKGEQEGRTQAILSIMYSPGECGWRCIPIPVPSAGSGK